MGISNFRVDVVTDAAGAFTGYTLPVSGEIEHIRYTPDGSIPLDTGADVTVTGEGSGIAIVTLTNIGTAAFTKAPRQATHDATGAAATYDGTHGVLARIALAGERIKFVVAQGGNALAGRFDVVVRSGD